MLLGPQGFEKVGDPAVDGAQAMETGVAGAAEGDQGRGAIGGSAVMDDEGRRGLADAAQVMVAGEDPFPAAAEAGPRAPAAVVAGLAQAASVEIRRSAGAAKRQLMLLALGGHRGISGFFSSAARRCAVWERPSHDTGTPLLSKLSFERKKYL